MKKILAYLILPLLMGCKHAPAQKTVEADLEEKQELSGAAKYFAELEANALKEPFTGIATENGIEKDLFPIKATGVSTAPIQKAADAFLGSLTPAQLQRIQFDIADDEWRKWSNVDNGIYERQGISLKEMNQAQKQSAYDLMRASLSAKGLQLSKDIMKTDQTLKEMNKGDSAFDEELYFFTVMGKPSPSEPWGWQLDGHHLVINYFVLGDQVVMSPVFMGGEPIITTTGKYKGNTLFQDEQNFGLAFMQSLTEMQQAEATLASSKTGNNIRTEASKDNSILNYEGVLVSTLSADSQEKLVHLISQYSNNIVDEHQKIKMAEIMTHWDRTYFAWVGATTADAVFYYRIHSPVVLIEFDHQGAVGVPNSPRGPVRNHIHTVVRTPNGNDYGKDLLRQHLEKSHKHN